MRVLFDAAFDQGAWPGPGFDRGASSGEAWVGFAGLLGLLETHLGLSGPPVGNAERAASLQAMFSAARGFWSESAEVAPLATARRLLHLRDTLRLHGWTGQPVAPRIAALAALTKGLDGSMADRLDAVVAALQHARGVLERLELLEPRDGLPVSWRRALAALEAAGTTIQQADLPAAPSPPKSDLARARRADFAPKGDGSFQLVRPLGPLESADCVAAALAASADVSTLVVGADGVLDAALHRHGLPTVGAGSTPSDNALLQVLPLTLELAWKRHDPLRALELLTLPDGPVPPSVAGPLVSALQAWPAIDSDAWREGVERGLGCIPDAGEREKVRARLRALFTPEAEGPRIAVGNIRARLAELEPWLRASAQALAELDPNRADRFFAALEQHERFLALFGRGQPAKLSRPELRSLVEEATGAAPCPALHPAQAGLPAVGDPGSVAGPAARIVWWDFTRASASRPARLGLSTAELNALAKAGVALPSPGNEARRLSAEWTRPLLQATTALWLVCPERDRTGEESHTHPMWDEVEARVAQGSSAAAVLHPEPRLYTPAKRVRRKALERVGPRDEWNAGVTIERRETESASSAERLLGCSFAWALQYPGHLHTGDTAALPSGPLLFGSLAHHLLSKLVGGGSKTPAQAEKEARALFESEAPRLATSLYVPGRLADLTQAREAIAGSARRLYELLAEGWKVESSELALTGKAFGTDLESIPDLVLHKRGKRAVLDFKWDGHAKRRDSITGGTAVQLSAYAELVRQSSSEVPDVAYFILRTQRVLSTSPSLAGAQAALSGPPIDQTWKAFAASHAEAWKRVAKGKLEAPGTRADAPAEASLDAGKVRLPPQCRYCTYGALCGSTHGLLAAPEEAP